MRFHECLLASFTKKFLSSLFKIMLGQNFHRYHPAAFKKYLAPLAWELKNQKKNWFFKWFSRLELQDCVERGWVIFGWPENHLEKSIEALINEEFRPNRVLVLQINEESAVERLINRLTDPETGIQYHTLYDPATEENVRNRLVQRFLSSKLILTLSEETR